MTVPLRKPRDVISLSAPTRYAVAVAAAAAAVLFRLALDPLWGSSMPFITLFPAIMLSGWLGGLWPGLVTTYFCALAAAYFWLEPAHSFAVADKSQLIGLFTFVAVGGLSSALNEAWRRATVAAARTEERLKEASRDLERASRLKDEFLAVLSHELRTPLNAVIGYAHLLSLGSLPPARAAHAIEAIQRNAEAQARLVESLLDLSRVMAGKLELNVEELDLLRIVDAAVDVVRPDADARAIRLDVVYPRSAVRLVGDAVRLQQVLWNLLANAVKFTQPGGRVCVRVTQPDSQAHIEVSDDGQGIDGTLLPHVFERLKQADNEQGHTPSGLGLGLALVQEMVLAHGGTVVAESPGQGQGSTFSVRLPLVGEVASTPRAEPAPDLDVRGTTPSVAS